MPDKTVIDDFEFVMSFIEANRNFTGQFSETLKDLSSDTAVDAAARLCEETGRLANQSRIAGLSLPRSLYMAAHDLVSGFTPQSAVPPGTLVSLLSQLLKAAERILSDYREQLEETPDAGDVTTTVDEKRLGLLIKKAEDLTDKMGDEAVCQPVAASEKPDESPSKGLKIRCEDQFFILPMKAVGKMLQTPVSALHEHGKQSYLHYQDKVFPAVYLSRFLSVDITKQPDRPVDTETVTVVLVYAGTRQVGVIVDEILGIEEMSISPLPEGLPKLSVFSGCAIMPDNRVVTVVNPQALG